MSRPARGKMGLAAVCLLVAGCGELVPAAGVAYLNDKPLANATLTFVPEDKMERNKRAASISPTDSEGNFILTTRKFGDGVKPGRYKVTVMKTVTPPNQSLPIQTPASPDGAQHMPQNMGTLMEQIRRNQRYWNIPPAYGSAETTPLTVDIPAGGNKNIDLRVSGSQAAGK